LYKITWKKYRNTVCIIDKGAVQNNIKKKHVLWSVEKGNGWKEMDACSRTMA
jgi:hypothetical protein